MNNGVPLTIVVCCVWPLIVHAALLYITRRLSTQDWTRSINIKFPWSKE